MERNDNNNFTQKIDRRSFLRTSEKIAVLLAIGMAKGNPVFCMVPDADGDTATDKKHRLMIPSVWWRQLAKTEEGALSYWDTSRIQSLKSNWVSVSYRPLDSQGNYVGTSWVIPPKMLEKVMELAKPGLRSAHKAGIQVFGTTDSMQFNPEVMTSAGVDPELLYGRSLAGKTVPFDTYQKGNHMSCLMNPNWQDIEATIGRYHAQAGFDGLFLDLFPYIVREGVLCGCSHCKKGWESYSLKAFGKSQNFPTGPLQLKNTIDRTFFSWRIEAIHHFMEKIQNAGRKFNPDFKVILNCNADNPCMAYLLLMGMLQPTSELGQLNAGNESSLYLYRMIESASQDPLFAQFNGQKQYLPEYKYKTALAEAFAAGGALMLAVKNEAMDEINRHFTDFLLQNKLAFEDSSSDARVAILFSWRDHTFLQSAPIVRTDRMIWNRNSARRTAAVLAAKGIPFDYIFVEKGITTSVLLKYDTIITPELKLLDNKDADSIKKYVKNGGNLLKLGAFGTLMSDGLNYVKRSTTAMKFFTAEETSNNYFQASVGKGKICAVPSFITGKNEEEMESTSDFDKALSFLKLQQQLNVENKGKGRIESTIFKNGKYKFIHLIRYACSGESGDEAVRIVYKALGKNKIASIVGTSPYTQNANEKLDWKLEGENAIISTSVDIYTMVQVELK